MDETTRSHLQAALDSLAEAAAAAGAPTDGGEVDLDALVDSDDPLFQAIGTAAIAIGAALDSDVVEDEVEDEQL